MFALTSLFLEKHINIYKLKQMHFQNIFYEEYNEQNNVINVDVIFYKHDQS
jgi:hypothetical protein